MFRVSSKLPAVSLPPFEVESASAAPNGIRAGYRGFFLSQNPCVGRSSSSLAWIAGMIVGLAFHKNVVLAYAKDGKDKTCNFSFNEPNGWSRAYFQVGAVLYMATGKLEISYSCKIPSVDQWSRIITYHRPDGCFGLVCQLRNAKGELLENFSFRTDQSGQGILVFDVRKEILDSVDSITLRRG